MLWDHDDGALFAASSGANELVLTDNGVVQGLNCSLGRGTVEKGHESEMTFPSKASDLTTVAKSLH